MGLAAICNVLQYGLAFVRNSMMCHEMSVQPTYAHGYRIFRNVIIAEVGECLEFY